MQDERIEHKVIVEDASPRTDGEAQGASQGGLGLLSRLYGLVSPRSSSPSPSSREMEERQGREIKQHQEEIKRLKEELTTKKRELQERVEEIKMEREERHREKELQKELNVAAPPDYTGVEVVKIHSLTIPEEKANIEGLLELNVPHSDPEQTGDDASVFDAAADELLESKLSTESSQHRLNEETISQQQQQINELNQEIVRLQAEFTENLTKETSEVERLKQRLEEERKAAAETLENEKRKFSAILEERVRASIEIDRKTREEARQAELKHQQEVNILREQQARTEAELLLQQEKENIARHQQRETQELILSERREVQARADAELLLKRQEEALSIERQIAENAQQVSISKAMESLGI